MNEKASDFLKQISTGIIRWISFDRTSSILIIDAGEDGYMHDVRLAVKGWLLGEGYKVSICSPTIAFSPGQDSGKQFGIILALGILETVEDPVGLLNSISQMLTSHGRLFLACGNRFGLRYFCGDRDYFTDRILDGIEGYLGVNAVSSQYLSGRFYSDKEIRFYLKDSGLSCLKRFSVFPDIRYPQLIYADGVMPNETLGIRLFPYYDHPDSAWLSEPGIIDQIVDGGLFHQMADGYLYECASASEETDRSILSAVTSVTLSLDRSRENACTTIIYEKEKVEKHMFFPEGEEKLKNLRKNHDALTKRGISAIEVEIETGGRTATMPYLDMENGMHYFSRKLDEGREAFLCALDRFVETVKKSSDMTEDENGRPVLEHGYIDMVPLNVFANGDNFIFFDQEFDIPMCPVEVIITRTLMILGSLGSRLNDIIPLKELYERYGIPLYGGEYAKLATRWHDDLKNRSILGDFRRAHTDRGEIIASNRHRNNVSTLEYEVLFKNILRDWDKRDFYIFGTGRFAGRFMETFGDRYDIKALIDNDSARQGKCLNGYKVIAPSEIPISDRIRVIICVKQYSPIVRQLRELGVSDICIYDPSVEIPDPKQVKEQLEREMTISSKNTEARYHIGYVSGVFDLFHVGHLNLLERASAMCDYLIVEVTSDEAVRRDKHIDPTIPAEDRIRIVGSLKCVDEVHEIPIEKPGTIDAWRRYHFDVQFRGSDYEGNEGSKDEREFLRKHGAELVILPYTETVSSTKIRGILNDRFQS